MRIRKLKTSVDQVQIPQEPSSLSLRQEDYGDIEHLWQSVRFLVKHGAWESTQTHRSLSSHLIDEAYECFQELTQKEHDFPSLQKELGDILLQVLLHSAVAEKGAGESYFSFPDVVEALQKKLFRRCAGVYQGQKLQLSEQLAFWDREKKAEEEENSKKLTLSIPVMLSQPTLDMAAELIQFLNRQHFPIDKLPTEILLPNIRQGDSLYRQKVIDFINHLNKLLKNKQLPQRESDWIDVLDD